MAARPDGAWAQSHRAETEFLRSPRGARVGKRSPRVVNVPSDGMYAQALDVDDLRVAARSQGARRDVGSVLAGHGRPSHAHAARHAREPSAARAAVERGQAAGGVQPPAGVDPLGSGDRPRAPLQVGLASSAQ